MITFGEMIQMPEAPTGGPELKPKDSVAVVLAGAGARGAYEAGFLATLLKADNPPLFTDKGLRPRIYIGTSAGAINASLFASLAHLPLGEMADEAIKVWRAVTKDMVLRPAVESLSMAAVGYGAGLFGLGEGPKALFDTSPLDAALKKLIDWDQLHANVRSTDMRSEVVDDNGSKVKVKVVDVVAAVTTEFGSGRTKVFYDTVKPELGCVQSEDSQAIDYVNTSLESEHVRASAAIPLAFSPVLLGPTKTATWHMDGGVRLNAPLKPALKFGANSLVVIATDPARFGTTAECDRRSTPPTLQEAALQVLRGALNDRMVQDVGDLLRTNYLIRMTNYKGGVPARYRDRPERPREPYRVVPILFGGPSAIGDVGGIASCTLSDILHGIRWATHPDLGLLNQLLSADADSRANLISFLLFEPEFIDGAINLGIQHAIKLLAESPDPWQLYPPGMDPDSGSD